MKKYRITKCTTINNTVNYCIEKKTLFGWKIIYYKLWKNDKYKYKAIFDSFEDAIKVLIAKGIIKQKEVVWESINQ